MFRAIVDTSLKQRLLVLSAALVLMVYGLFSLRQLPIDVFPDLTKPTVVLQTEAHGMAPEEVEQQVTLPIETAIGGLPEVSTLRSVSGIGLSVVTVEFDWGTDIHRSREQIAARLNSVQGELPPGIVPQMGPISSIMGEIMLIALRSDTATPMQVREAADWVVRPRLLAIPGVSQVISMGGEIEQYQVTPNTVLMRAHQVSLQDLENALEGFSSNSSGGFLTQGAQEYLIRHIGRTARLEDLQNLVVDYRNGVPVLLKKVAEVAPNARVKRGDASFNGAPAVILSVQKQPQADTLWLTREIEAVLDDLDKTLPAGISTGDILFKQSDFIEAAAGNVGHALRDGAIIVAVVLFLFLVNFRTTIISLSAIPLSLLTTILVFKYFDLSINTMTLGGLAIAIGELVDDAVVGMENVLRRLKQNAKAKLKRPVIEVIADATVEVRSAIVYATLIIVLVFVPLFALSGLEGRLFAPLGVAYIVSILASMLVSVTLTPVLCYYLLPGMKTLQGGDGLVMRSLKAWDAHLLAWSFERSKWLVGGGLLAVLIAIVSVALFPRSFLPPLNEGTLTVNLVMDPGISLAQSNEIGTLAERLILQVPEVTHVGRRTGRAELDEHAQGLNGSELEIGLDLSERNQKEVTQDIRGRLNLLPLRHSIGQPITHRLDHLLSGISAPIVLKIYGNDLDTLRALAGDTLDRLADIPGLDILQERQAAIPQLQVRLDYAKAAQYGVTPAGVNSALETLVQGKEVAEINDQGRRFDVLLRVADSDRDTNGLANLLIETPSGHIPLRFIADITEGEGPSEISRDNNRRRIVLYGNAEPDDLGSVTRAIRAKLAEVTLPEAYSFNLEGQYQAQEDAAQLIAGLSLMSFALIFLVLYSRYLSVVLSLMIMVNIPLALIGSVIALAIAGIPLSVASMVGFVTLAGISARNGILKISHYINLVAHEGEVFGKEMIVRGSLERLTPVLMTALVTALALIPLMLSAGDPGKEILYPVAVVIFGGLISSTLLDTLLTPVMFYLWGGKPLAKLLAQRAPAQIAEESF